MAHYNEINVQKLYIACKSLEDYINEKVEAMNLGGEDYTAVLTRLSDQVQALSNALQSADPDNAAVTLLKTLSDDFAVEAGKVEGTSYSEIITKINTIATTLGNTDEGLIKTVTGITTLLGNLPMANVEGLTTTLNTMTATIGNTDEGLVKTVAGITTLLGNLPMANVEGLTTTINELKVSSFEGMKEEKTDHRDPADDTYKYYAVDGGEIYLGTIDKKIKGIYSETSDIERIVVSKEVDYVKTNLHGNPTAGQIRTYFKTDGNLYKRDENGNESKIGSTPDFVYPDKDSGEIWLGSDAIKLGGVIAKQGNFQNVDVTNDVILEGNSLKGKLNNLQTAINNIDNSASGSSVAFTGSYSEDFPILDTSDIVIHYDGSRNIHTDYRLPAFKNKVEGIQRITWSIVNEYYQSSGGGRVDSPDTTTTYSCSGTSRNYHSSSPTQVFIVAEKEGLDSINAIVYAYRFNSWRMGTDMINGKRATSTTWQKII